MTTLVQFLFLVLSVFGPKCEHDYSLNCTMHVHGGQDYVAVDLHNGTHLQLRADGVTMIAENV